jgi:hypothetical protein
VHTIRLTLEREIAQWRSSAQTGIRAAPAARAAIPRVSTLRLVSGAAGLSGNPALVEGVGPLEALGAWVGASACTAGPVKATGCANADGNVMAGTGALLTRALWRPTE